MKMMDVEMGNYIVSPALPLSETEEELSRLFSLASSDPVENSDEEVAGSEADGDSEEEVADLKTECTICKKTVSRWLNLIIPEEGEQLSKIEDMSEAEREQARKSYCLECADAQVWYWQYVERNPHRHLTTAQWREVTIHNLRENFGLLQGVNERLIIADYFGFCRGCNDINARVDAGVPCRDCKGLTNCSVCDRTRNANVRIIQIQGVNKCTKCLGGKKRVVTFRLDHVAIAPEAPTYDEDDESMASESEAE
jgi:hypothetical protein